MVKTNAIHRFTVSALLLVAGGFVDAALADPPASFDLRDVAGENYVTSIKMQEGGTCWTHGAMASMESNLLITGAWASAGESGEPNLAEYHLDWWNGFNDFNNDDTDPPCGGGLTVHEGGDYMVTAAYLARGEGAVRDIDGQSFAIPPQRYDSNYHYFYVRDIEWFVAGEDLSNIDIIKQKIMETGAIATCMGGGNYMVDYVWYQPPHTTEGPWHAIAIIGWDDNKPTQAPQPGAWICKNSWGDAFGEEGYFWISFYDKHCGQRPDMGAVSFQNVEPFAYDRVYYHDYHGCRDTMPECTEVFNAFVAAGEDLLEAVSFFVVANNVSYTVKIYDRFENGELLDELAAKSGTVVYTGFHTVDLDSSVQLTPTDQFFIYLYLSAGGQAYDRTSDVPVLLGAHYRTIVGSSSNPGESFYRSGSTWYDLYEDDTTANFCIKGLAVENPSLKLLLPEGTPGTVAPYEPTVVLVQIIDGNQTYVDGTGLLHYRLDGGVFLTTPLVHYEGDSYTGTIPSARCDEFPEFYFSAQGDGGTTVFSPYDAPNSFYAAPVGVTTVSMEDDFETDQGWMVQSLGATAGLWERGIPVIDPDYGSGYGPHADSDGSGCCYLTGNYMGDSDVDNGAVSLMSPIFAMSEGETIAYDYYLYLGDAASGSDALVVEINSTSGVGKWAQIARHDTHNGWSWNTDEVTGADLIAADISLTSTMRVRFVVNDGDPQSIVEAGIDAFRVYEFVCEPDYPDVPVLLTPPDSSVIADDTPEFTWTPTADTGGTYTLQYSQDSLFDVGVVTKSGLADAHFTPAAGEELEEGVWHWRVEAMSSEGYPSGYQDSPFLFTVSLWICGDADSGGEVDIDDVVCLIAYIFSGGPEPVPYAAGDTDCSGTVDIDDAVQLINYIFLGGNEPCDTNGDGTPDC